MGSDEHRQPLSLQQAAHADSVRLNGDADATAYRRETAQELNNELAQDLQNAAAAGKSPSAVSPATPPEQDGLAAEETSHFPEGW